MYFNEHNNPTVINYGIIHCGNFLSAYVEGLIENAYFVFFIVCPDLCIKI